MDQLVTNNNEDQIKELMGKLIDVCLVSPHFVKRKFNDLIHVMGRVRELDPDQNSNLKVESVECLVNVIEKYQDLVEKDDNTLRKVVELIFKNMVEIEDQISPEWASPPAGFNDDCLEDDD